MASLKVRRSTAFAADELVNALIPGIAAMSQEEAREWIGRAMADVSDAMEAFTTYFAIAIADILVNSKWIDGTTGFIPSYKSG